MTINSLSTFTCTYINEEPQGVAAGTCTLQLTQAGNTTTAAAESKTLSFDVFNASAMSATPDINHCYAGKLSPQFRKEFLTEINHVRAYMVYPVLVMTMLVQMK